jgi:predicted RNA methylase
VHDGHVVGSTPGRRSEPTSRRRTDESGGRQARRAVPTRAATARRGATVEVTFLPGLGEVVADEIVERLTFERPPCPAPGRDDALRVDVDGPLAEVLELRTAVAAFVVRHFDVPRPRSLTSGDHLARIVDAMYASLRVGGSASFRFEAAGSDSAVFARLAQLLHEATGLAYEPEHGELVVRVARGHASRPDVDPGWDVLVRLGPRPLSARRWREVDFPGAANATIAAAMSRLAGIGPHERVLNLMCGSGTLLVERLLAGPAATAVGVDDDPAALEATTANLRAAGLRIGAAAPGAAPARAAGTVRPTTVRLVQADATSPSALAAALDDETYDLVLADPPWGALHGSHETGAAVHAGLLAAAHAVTAPGGRLAVLTHEVRIMERALSDAAALWTPAGPPLRVFAKGHHPRIWVLQRA